MKKQLLIAAVAATMTSVAFADVSISGAAQVNYTTTDFDSATVTDTNAITHDFDLKITGKSGATTVVMDIENTDAAADAAADGTFTLTSATTGSQTVTSAKTDNELNVKNAYMTTSIAGVNVKMGTWYGTDSLLGNGSQTEDQVSLDTTISGVKVQYEDNMATSSITLSGTVAGVAVSHEIFDTKTDSSVSGSFGGVNVAYRSVADDRANSDKSSLEVSTEMQGVTLTYAEVDVDTANQGTSDDFFGEVAAVTAVTAANGVTAVTANANPMRDASGFGIKTSMAGNTLNLKSYEIGTTDYVKLVATRPLASGATVEATYLTIDSVTASEDNTSLDLELRVKF